MKTIASIIRKYDLKPGDAMRNIAGDVIEDSMVVDAVTWLSISRDDMTTRYPGSGPDGVPPISVGRERLAALASLPQDGQVRSVLVDGRTVSHHRTLAGAVRATTDHISSCLKRIGGTPLEEAEISMISAVLNDRGHLDLQMRDGILDAVPGMTPERITLLAMIISRDYVVETVALLD